MNEVVVRPRYNKNSTINRRKKKNIRQADKTNTFFINLIRQVMISAIILLLLFLIKRVDTPATNFIVEKTKAVVSQNVDIKSIFSSIDNALKRVTGNKNAKKDNTPIEKDPVQTDAGTDKSGTISGEVAKTDTGSNSQTSTVAGTSSIVNKDITNNTKQSSSNVNTDAKKGIFIEPVSGYLSSDFGERTNPFKNIIENHKGIDIEANKGITIKAAMSGEVTETGNEPTYGLYIKIKHDDGFTTVYAHCSYISVKKGQKVKQGDIIAKVGDTGLATGAHLHFEIWKDEKAVNPLEYINVPSKS